MSPSSRDNRIVRGCVIALLAVSALAAKDERRLELLRQAQGAFDRVEQRLTPQLADASSCVRPKAAMLSVPLPAELAQLHYRKGYCELAASAITRNGFLEAAADLEQGGDKTLTWLARLQSGAGDVVTGVSLSHADVSMPAQRTASLWQGFLSWKRGDLNAAARSFAGLTETGWPAFVSGLQAFRQARYREASTQFRQAVDAWTAAQRNPIPTFYERLAPPADISAALIELGGAQLLAGDLAAAIATLTTALQGGPPQARAYYLRARAKELAGQTEPSLADYNLASRTAFANAQDLASGEAHLYRGILLYRRRDFTPAED